MKKITEYQCELCGSRYKTEAEARECESIHKTPDMVGCGGYGKNDVFPDFIIVGVNGETHKYKYWEAFE